MPLLLDDRRRLHRRVTLPRWRLIAARLPAGLASACRVGAPGAGGSNIRSRGGGAGARDILGGQVAALSLGPARGRYVTRRRRGSSGVGSTDRTASHARLRAASSFGLIGAPVLITPLLLDDRRRGMRPRRWREITCPASYCRAGASVAGARSVRGRATGARHVPGAALSLAPARRRQDALRRRSGTDGDGRVPRVAAAEFRCATTK
uniref:Predicted protein n=1 Tax=Hordeum vulgare subsp. vulgare TaxID=112509 RepID=F2DZY4_HORVV|nr:predicted protein [Hordeum vulgare subsp. vulgare]